MLLAWVAGTAVQLTQVELGSGWDYLWPVLLSLGMCVAIFGLRFHTATLGWLCVMLTVAALAFASVGWRSLSYQAHSLPADLQGVDLEVTGTVVGLPQRQADGWRFQFKVLQAQRSDHQNVVELPGLLQLGWYANEKAEYQEVPTLRTGQQWRLPLRLKQPHGLVNPGGFDVELWLWEQGIHATGYVRTAVNSPPPELLARVSSFSVAQWRQAARDGIQAQVSEARWAAVIAALLIGDQAGMDRADWALFRATGVAHLMSISGLHITLWAWVARCLIAKLWRYSDVWGNSWCLTIPAVLVAQWGACCWLGCMRCSVDGVCPRNEPWLCWRLCACCITMPCVGPCIANGCWPWWWS